MYPMAWYWRVQELERDANPEHAAAEQRANDMLRAAHAEWARTTTPVPGPAANLRALALRLTRGIERVARNALELKTREPRVK